MLKRMSIDQAHRDRGLARSDEGAVPVALADAGEGQSCQPCLLCQRQRRSFVVGAYWWTHAILKAVFAAEGQAPVFCRNFNEALSRAIDEAGQIVAWASRLPADHEQAAATAGIPVVRVEDGFIRSVGLGAGFATCASLAVDRTGIHYDARRPSDLETLLQDRDVTEAERKRGASLRQRLVAAKLSKYNLTGARSKLPWSTAATRTVLVPGQVSDDHSIKALVSDTIDPRGPVNVNVQLLAAARRRQPRAFIVYKPHPDVSAGLRAGHVRRDIALQYADLIAADDADILHLIETCDEVETISSLTGFEALLRARAVTVHGLPFYAGWGLTHDMTRCARRTRRRGVDELVFLAFAVYAQHMHPVTYRRCSPEELIDALAARRASRWQTAKTMSLRQVAWVCAKLGL